MLKTIKKNSRISKNFHSSFLACLTVAVLVGVFLAQVLNQTTLPIWSTSILKWTSLSIVLTILLIISYVWGMSKCGDIKEKQNFYDNFFMSIMVILISTTIVLYNPFLLKGFNWLYASAGILILYFPLNLLYIKLRPN